MEFQLQFNLPNSDFKVQHGKPVVLIGSCFSEELVLPLSGAGINVLGNPFGTLFHPIAIAKLIQHSIDDIENERLFSRDCSFYSWDLSTKLLGNSEEELLQNIKEQQEHFLSYLKKAQLLVVTFGSAFGYRLKSDGELVANCHKMPKGLFDKELSSIQEMKQYWLETLKKIKRVNPTINILLTVSPVRHKKDGLVENNRSKARLLELTHQLTEESSACYFPSYEIVNDVLRDYRFFKRDLVHPNELAVEYVWDQFKTTYFDENAINIANQVEQYYRFANHKVTDKEKQAIHSAQVQRKKVELKQRYPEIYL